MGAGRFGLWPGKLIAGVVGNSLPQLLTSYAERAICGCISSYNLELTVQAKLFSGFGKVPAGFGVGILDELVYFFAAAIANKHQLIAIRQKTPKHNGSVGRCPVWADGR